MLASGIKRDVGARVFNSAAISVPNNASTALTFDSERWDTDNIHSTATNTSRLTAQTAGKYIITGHVRFANNVTGRRVLLITLNVAATQIGDNSTSVTANGDGDLTVSTIYNLAVGDFVELYAYQDSGAALNVTAVGNTSPEFAMQLLA